MNHEASIAVVEDDESVRRALLRQFSSAGFHAVGFGSAADFKHAAHDLFDCVVLDVQLPMMDGLQLQAELKRDLPCASIVFITGHGDLSVGVHAMRQGAVDFLEKPVDDDVLLESVRRGVELSRKRRAAQARRVDLGRRYQLLTRREREVFDLVTCGRLNKQVGAELGTTERTIKTHRGRVMEKMSAESLAELVQMATILGIRTLPS
ncbi:MAG TPA: response regulator [Candidatus Binataceae bacterium]|jgi:FixJ family two-component response regulator|nr:response regulator [Candidatus Binataceae bacterium]